jgi:spermidine synthase
VKPFELLGRTDSADGIDLKLVRRDDEYLILADGKPLMSSRVHGSEEAMATSACRNAQNLEHPHVLVGGLGMGFTLRAALRILPPQASVVVVELLPAVVEWNRGPLGELAGYPLQDKRVRVETNDVAATLRSCRNHFDAVMLDVDNGPAAFTASNNAALYDDAGISHAFRALKRDGVLAVWSAREDKTFEWRLCRAGFAVKVEKAGARARSGSRHTIYLAHKSTAGSTRKARSTRSNGRLK